jgi:hypothetical protein
VPAGLIPSLRHPVAAGLLRSVARNETYSSGDRFSAIYQLAIFRDPAAQELLETFTRDRSNKFYHRHRAVIILGTLNQASALAAIETFADGPHHLYIRAITAAAEWDLPGTRRRLKEMIKEIPVWQVTKRLTIRLELVAFRLENRHPK